MRRVFVSPRVTSCGSCPIRTARLCGVPGLVATELVELTPVAAYVDVTRALPVGALAIVPASVDTANSASTNAPVSIDASTAMFGSGTNA